MLSKNIKEATKVAHQELEKEVLKRIKAIRSNADYADLLRYFYAYFNHVEIVVSRFITDDALPGYSDRRTAADLKSDIETLGASIQDLPATSVPGILNILQALGALYVLEGSIMGGSIVVQMLKKAGVTTGVSFFSGYGPEAGQKWRTFMAILNTYPETQAEEAVIIGTANDTFARFAELFQHAGTTIN